MKKVFLTILQYIIFLGLGIWLIYHMLHQLKEAGKLGDLINAIESINLWYLIPIFIVGFCSHFFRALRWRLLLETIDAKPSVVNTTFAVLIGYIANLILPRAGEVAKCTVLARYEKTPAHKMVGTIVAERAFDVLCLFIITFFAFLLQANVIRSFAVVQYHNLRDLLSSHKYILLGMIVLGVAAIVALILVYRRHRENKIGLFIKELGHGILSIFLMKKRWQFIGYTFLIWLMYTMQIYIGFFSLSGTSHLSILAALVVLVYGSVAVILTPGGIGAYTAFVAAILVYYSVDDVSAQAFGWIAWAVQTGIICLLGMLSLILLPLYNRNKYAQITVDTKQDIQS